MPEQQAKKPRKRNARLHVKEDSMSVFLQSVSSLTPKKSVARKNTVKALFSNDAAYEVVKRKIVEGVHWKAITEALNAAFGSKFSESSIMGAFRQVSIERGDYVPTPREGRAVKKEKGVKAAPERISFATEGQAAPPQVIAVIAGERTGRKEYSLNDGRTFSVNWDQAYANYTANQNPFIGIDEAHVIQVDWSAVGQQVSFASNTGLDF